MHTTEVLALVAAGAGAGLANSIAGGGTILTFPALLMVGLDSIRANATSTVALLVGILGSVVGYRRHMAEAHGWLGPLIPVSIIAGFLGGLLLTLTPSKVFDGLVPFLILFATVLFLLQSRFGKKVSEDTPEPERPSRAAVIGQFFIALYGGYFGAGIGILMLATLGHSGLHNIHRMNAVKTILGALVNIVVAVYFIICGLVDWEAAMFITLGALPGYYVGSRLALRVRPITVRRTIAAIGIGIAGVMFYRQFIALKS
jgi:uncharacterized membrane protein YfcA